MTSRLTNSTIGALKTETPVRRQIPRLMMPPVIASKVEAASNQVTAFVNEKEGVCPLCDKQMSLSVANGVDVYVCLSHRVAMPIRNEGQ